MKCTVIGALYGEESQYYGWDSERRFPFYEKAGEMEWEIEADDLDEAERWLAVNHPEYYMGSCIVSENKEDFVMTAIPCCEYGAGNYETVEARRRWASTIIGC